MRKFAAVAAVAVSVFAVPVTFAAESAEVDAGDISAPAMGTEATVVPPRDFLDVAVPGWTTVAGNPKNPKNLVATASGACLAYRSSNGGRTWSRPVALPIGIGYLNECYQASVAYAPDGKSVYAAYEVDPLAASAYETNILVTRSEDNGATWRRPVVAAATLDGIDVEYYSLVLTTPVRATDADGVYLIAFYVSGDGIGPCESIVFARSVDRGANWSPPKTVTGACPGDEGDIIGDATVAGGVDGDVLVAWTHYASLDQRVLGTVKVRRSQNHGATFGPTIVAATDVALYPDWYAQLDAKVGNQGTAHIVYQRQAPSQGDQGDIGYIWGAPPYRTWAAPVTISDDTVGSTQSAPLLATQTCGSTTLLQVAWGDARKLYPDTDVFYTRKLAQPGSAWSTNLQVSDSSGGSPAGLATSPGGAFATWYGYGSRILSGVTCP
ncbi:MAG: sialidase family protein [Rhodospirillales bacterium]